MALRISMLVLALSVVVLGGCRTRSNYQPAPRSPAVLAVTPIIAPVPCPTPGVIVAPAPPPGVIVRP